MRFLVSVKTSEELGAHAGTGPRCRRGGGIVRGRAWVSRALGRRRYPALLAVFSALVTVGVTPASPASADQPGWFDNTDDVLLDNPEDGFCADLPGWFAPTSGMQLQEYYCRPHSDNQRFDFIWQGQIYGIDLYTIRPSLNHSLCVDPEGVGTPYRGNLVKVFKCVGNPLTQDNQLWYLQPAYSGAVENAWDPGPYMIRQTRGSEHLCLSPRATYYITVNNPIILYPCGSPITRWIIQ
jgi:hypothetical protein